MKSSQYHHVQSTRPVYPLLDRLLGIILGLTSAAFAAWVAVPGGSMFFAMLVGMVVGMSVAMFLSFLVAPVMGMFEVMIPGMWNGMVAGMLAGMAEAMWAPGVAACSLLGAAAGLAITLAFQRLDDRLTTTR